VARVAHAVDVHRAYALLVIHEVLPGGVRLAQKVGHKRVHPRGDEQHRRVVVGDEGLPLYLRVAMGPEKLNVLRAKFVGCHEGRIAEKGRYGKKTSHRGHGGHRGKTKNFTTNLTNPRISHGGHRGKTTEGTEGRSQGK